MYDSCCKIPKVDFECRAMKKAELWFIYWSVLLLKRIILYLAYVLQFCSVGNVCNAFVLEEKLSQHVFWYNAIHFAPFGCGLILLCFPFLLF